MPMNVCCGGDIGMCNITDTQMENIWQRPRFHVFTATRGIVLIAVI